MIKIYSLYDKKTQTIITNFCKTITWSGDVEQVARKLEVTMAYSIFDKNQPHTQIGTGTLIWMVEDDKEIFRGIVFDREINSSTQELRFTAFDFLIYFTKSKGTYNFTNISPEDIVRTICGDAGVAVGDIGTSGYKLNLLAKQKSFYEIIMMAYTKVWHLNGGRYNFMPYMDSDKLGMMNMGTTVENFILRPETNIGNTTYSDTINNMINKVNVYKSDGTYVGTAWERDWIKAFGVLQEVIEQEEGKDGMTEANNMLHGVDQTVTISALGNSKCRAGYAVKTKIFYIDVLQDATLYIESDSHTWEVATGKHTMDLTLNFNCKMKLVEEG